MTGPRYEMWANADHGPDVYESFPLRYGLALAAVLLYGGLLVFLAGDGRYGWFALAVLVPSLLALAGCAAGTVIRRHVDTALFDDWDGCDRHPACQMRPAAEVQR